MKCLCKNPGNKVAYHLGFVSNVFFVLTFCYHHPRKTPIISIQYAFVITIILLHVAYYYINHQYLVPTHSFLMTFSPRFCWGHLFLLFLTTSAGFQHGRNVHPPVVNVIPGPLISVAFRKGNGTPYFTENLGW